MHFPSGPGAGSRGVARELEGQVTGELGARGGRGAREAGGRGAVGLGGRGDQGAG